jgi:hypothetical protein
MSAGGVVTRCPGDTEEMRLGGCPVFVGRVSELASCLALVEGNQCDGVGRAVFIAGEAGVGKSRLVRELAGRARDGDCRVVGARAIEGSSVPLRLVSEVATVALAQLRGGRHDSPGLEPFGPCWRTWLRSLGMRPVRRSPRRCSPRGCCSFWPA